MLPAAALHCSTSVRTLRCISVFGASGFVALAHAAKKAAPTLNIEYLTLDEYVEAFHASVAAGQGDAFRRRLCHREPLRGAPAVSAHGVHYSLIPLDDNIASILSSNVRIQ